MSLLADLLSPILSSDFVTSVKAVAQGVGLLPDSWAPLDPEDAIVEGVGETFATNWNTWMTVAIQGGFLDTAALIGNPTGDPKIPASGWCKLLASSVFNVPAIPASFATGTWNGVNSTASPVGPFAAGQLKFYDVDTNATYSNQGSVTFAASTTTPITLIADVIGSVSNAAPSKISLLTTVLGVSGTNPLALIGLDNESGPSLANRCRLKYASLSPNGPSQAYQYVSLTPSLNGLPGSSQPINRVLVSPSSTNGTVTEYIASVAGALTDPVNDPIAVQTSLYTRVVPDTVRLTVLAATAHVIPVTYSCYYHTASNINPTTEAANASNALVTLFQTLPIGGENTAGGGGFVYKDRIIGALQVACPKAFQIAVTLPANDVAIASTEVPTLGSTNPVGASFIVVVS